MRQKKLPVQVTQAAMPIFVGIAGVALKTGWRLLQEHLANRLQPSASTAAVSRPRVPKRDLERPASAQPISGSHQGKRTIRIRSSWAVKNGQGPWQQGHEEHIIEIDD